MTTAPRREPRVSILALPQSTPAVLYGFYEVLAAAGRTWEDLTGEPGDGRRLAPGIVTRDGLPVTGALGFPIGAHGPLDDADVVVVTDIAVPEMADLGAAWGPELCWLRARHAAGAVICSVCTGSVVLAEAGLLDGLEATTHWAAVDFMRSRYPAVKLAPRKILAPAGPDARIVTGGGAAAWEDMALHLVARLCGSAEAVRIAKIFLLGDRSDGQLPFTGPGRPKHHEDGTVAAVQGWIAGNYHLPGPVARMVERSGLTGRTFMRRFRAATGYAPMDYVQALRIEEAKHLLETTAAPVDEVAADVGYEDPHFFRRLFKRRVGITPARYRQRFATLRQR